MKNSKTVKVLPCKYCGTKVDVGERATAVTCWRCTHKMASGHNWDDKIFLDEIEEMVKENKNIENNGN